MEIKIGLLVWLMVLNKPVQLKVSKIIKTDELTAATDEPQLSIKAFASYSKEYKHEQELNLREVFETKEALLDSLFK